MIEFDITSEAKNLLNLIYLPIISSIFNIRYTF